MDWIALIIIAAVPFALTAFAVMYFRDQKKSKHDVQDLLADKGALYMVTLPHAAGLPLPEKTVCTLFYCNEHIEINGNGVSFKLDLIKIHDISIKTREDIQKQLVSSAGGAIAGAHLAGWVGAAIFGRVHERQIKTTTQYLMFTYTKDSGGIDFIGFQADYYKRYTQYFVDEFRKRPQNPRSIAL
jgi:hypothetical protein